MKKNKDRVLAYKLAQEIPNEQLNEITGGSAQLTTQGTMRAQNGSFEIDGLTDW